MPHATCLFRQTPFYPRPEFAEGLRRHGYDVSNKRPHSFGPDDLLLIWNRNRQFEPIAAQYEAAGARVLVAENGYIDRTDDRKAKYYALALNRHNGAGRWFIGDKARFEISEEPWRKRGDHILVLPQRGIGSQGVRMPSAWVPDIMKRLHRITDRPIKLRHHPGHRKHQRDDLLEALNGCHAAVTWGSGAGIKSLRAGIPVFHELDKWIGNCAARRLVDNVENVHMPDRTELWRRVSWGQWTLPEIATGEAFDRLLHAEDRDLLRL